MFHHMRLSVLAVAVSGFAAPYAGFLATAPTHSINTDSIYAPTTGATGFDGEVTIALGEEIAAIDPHLINLAHFRVAGNVVESLVDIDSTSGELEPNLATSWHQVDSRTWRFELREDVKFSSGEPFNAEAAAWGITRATDPDAEYSVTLRSVMSLEGVTAKAVDEYTLEVSTSTPSPTLPREMYLIRLPAPLATGDQTNVLVGTGPYVVEEFVPSERLVLARNDSYWGPLPEVSRATFLFREESGVRRAMLDTGEADLVPLNPEDTEGVDTVQSTVSQVILVHPDLVCPVTSDIRVREAMNLAIDREGLAEELYAGLVEPASQVLIPQVPGHSDSLEPIGYDQERAKALISEAASDGVPVDRPLTLVTRPGYFVSSDEVAELVAAQLNEIGLNVTVDSMERAQYTPLLTEPDPSPERCLVFLITPTNRVFDPAATLFNYYHSEGTVSMLDDPQFDEMFAEAAALPDGEDRSTAFADLIDYVTNEVVPGAPLLYWAEGFGVGDDITYQPRIDGVIELALITAR